MKMTAYYVLVCMGLSEDNWIIHTDLELDQLGKTYKGEFHYDHIVAAFLVSYYKGYVMDGIRITPPIPMIPPLNLEGLNIHKQVLITRGMVDGVTKKS